MICPNYTKDATGSWGCGARGRNCTMKYNPEVFCDIKPKVKSFVNASE
jgi:hypothetical protein